MKGRAERSRTRTVESAAIRVDAHRDDPENLALILPEADAPVAPTHWSFGQLASLVSAPAAYLRQLMDQHARTMSASDGGSVGPPSAWSCCSMAKS